jgi:putative addiction module component (TIGR02574 family)
MTTDIAEIEAKVRALSPEDKMRLLRVLVTDLDGPPEADVERAWIHEAKRRQRELDDGSVAPVPGERVFANLRARLGR